MPITYEAPAPIGLAENVYNQTAQREAALRARELAAASYGRVGGGGGGGGDNGAEMQAAINHRDDYALKQQAQNDAGNVTQAQVFGAQAQSAQQRQSYQLQAQLQSVELSQTETMRLQRMKNAVGEVSADPSLSADEKSAMILQLKTGIDPYEKRQAAQKIAADTQLKEQEAEKFKFAAATEKAKLDTLGKTATDRTSFVPDTKQLAAITQHLDETTPQFPPEKGGTQARQAFIADHAKQEAVRQGLGTTFMLDPDGKQHALSGPGSKSHDDMLKGEGATDHSQMTTEKYLKMREDATKIVDNYAKETKEGDIPGTKVPAHPELADRDKRRIEVEKELASMGAPRNLEEFNKLVKTKPTWGYDKTKAPWYKAPAAPVATVATPDATQKPFTFEAPETPEQKASVANFQGLDQKLKDAKAPAEMRQNAIADWGEAKQLLQKAGSVGNMDADQKRRFLAAMDSIAKTIKHDPATAPSTPAPAGAAPAPAAPGGQSAAPAESPWWAGATGGQYGGQIGNFSRGVGRLGEALGNIEAPDTSGIERLYRSMSRNKGGR